MSEIIKSNCIVPFKAAESNDADFEMTAEMMVDDYDDEQTIEEEENLNANADGYGAEVNDLHKVYLLTSIFS